MRSLNSLNRRDGNKMKEIKNIENLHSVKLAINAKLQYSAEIKIYNENADTAFTEACRIAKLVEDLIRVKNNEN